jgi:hypothetical protein
VSWLRQAAEDTADGNLVTMDGGGDEGVTRATTASKANKKKKGYYQSSYAKANGMRLLDDRRCHGRLAAY